MDHLQQVCTNDQFSKAYCDVHSTLLFSCLSTTVGRTSVSPTTPPLPLCAIYACKLGEIHRELTDVILVFGVRLESSGNYYVRFGCVARFFGLVSCQARHHDVMVQHGSLWRVTPENGLEKKDQCGVYETAPPFLSWSFGFSFTCRNLWPCLYLDYIAYGFRQFRSRNGGVLQKPTPPLESVPWCCASRLSEPHALCAPYAGLY